MWLSYAFLAAFLFASATTLFSYHTPFSSFCLWYRRSWLCPNPHRPLVSGIGLRRDVLTRGAVFFTGGRCPFCRKRLHVWVRQNTGRLVDQRLWREVQAAHPTRVARRLAELADAEDVEDDAPDSVATGAAWGQSTALPARGVGDGSGGGGGGYDEADENEEPAPPRPPRVLAAPGELRRE
jgi:hypothetical protein